MIAAIYARKSTDDSDRNEDARSTARQIERAREYAVLKGWAVDEQYIFVDEAVSGVEWQHRHGFNRLVATLDPHPPFQVLIVSELSRIGRDTVRTPYFVQQIEEAGVAIWGYLSDQRISLADESSEIHTIFNSLAASFERRRASQTTRDALKRRAEQGYVTGGKCYGYLNVREGAFVKRVIDPDEAAVVRRIFEMYASGAGMVTIAHRLNEEGVRPPCSRGWAPSGIREMLYRGAYRGEVTWGKLQKVTRKGTKRQQHRPKTEWLTVSVPALRIIPEDLAQRVAARLDERAAIFPRSRDRKTLMGRPRYQDESAYLLTGFARCTSCGGPVGTEIRRHGKRSTQRTVVHHYACLDHKRRGQAICANAVVVRQDLLDRAILSAIVDALDPAVLTLAVETAVASLTKRQRAQIDRRSQAERELFQVQQRLDRLVDALADGSLPQGNLRARLSAETSRKKALQAELQRLEAIGQVAAMNVEKLTGRINTKVRDIVSVLGRQTPQARQMLRKLLTEKIDLEPVGSGRARGYKFRGSLAVDRLISGEAIGTHLTVVAPTGFGRQTCFQSCPSKVWQWRVLSADR
jgi:DNA invertase Pin-like site-specific DNA recombinase